MRNQNVIYKATITNKRNTDDENLHRNYRNKHSKNINNHLTVFKQKIQKQNNTIQNTYGAR